MDVLQKNGVKIISSCKSNRRDFLQGICFQKFIQPQSIFSVARSSLYDNKPTIDSLATYNFLPPIKRICLKIIIIK